MECIKLSDRPFVVQFLSVERRWTIYDKHQIKYDGTLLREENGVITASGTEEDPYTTFRIYKYIVEDKLAYKIQSVTDETYLAIDKESENLVMKSDPEDKSTLFWSKKVFDESEYKVLESVVGLRSYIYVEQNGDVITTKIYDDEDLKKTINTWFEIRELGEN